MKATVIYMIIVSSTRKKQNILKGSLCLLQFNHVELTLFNNGREIS